MTGLPATTDHLPRRTARVLRAVAVPLLLVLVVSAGATGTVRIKRGDTLWSLAQKHNTTVQALRELNGIPGNSSLIVAGRLLKVPTKAKPARPATPAPKAPTVNRYHTVVRGDSLIAIARRYGKTPLWVSDKNNLPASGIVVLGARLIVGTAPGTAARPAPRPPAQPVSRDRVRSLIRAEAGRAGVDPEFALALAYLESGFQQQVVSHAGAIGVMQVMPETGKWVGQYLVGRPLDLRDVEDNVVAGVRYIAMLIRITGDHSKALAGYYQGLASVRRNGLYTETKQYVANILAIQRRFERG
jgi:soluble lytic murein transglycosylase-like protein